MAIDFSADQGVGFITFNRPPANAYDAQMLGELTQAVHRVAEDPAVRVAVVRSANPKFFCTGADISTLQNADRAGFANFLTIAQEAVDAIGRTPSCSSPRSRGIASAVGWRSRWVATFASPRRASTSWGWPR